MSKVNVGIETSSWLNIAAGIVVAGIAYDQTSELAGPFYSGVIGGAVLVLAGAYTAWAAATDRARSTRWASGITLLTGLWLAAYPWFVGVTDTYLYATVAAGVVVAVLSGYEMWAAGSEPRMARRPTA